MEIHIRNLNKMGLKCPPMSKVRYYLKVMFEYSKVCRPRDEESH